MSEQNAFEAAMNAAQDEKTIAGLVTDVASALADYQVQPIQHDSRGKL
jgi:hypothetical protein